MARFFKKRFRSKGKPPGTPVFIGDVKVDKPRIRVIDYSCDTLVEYEFDDIKECSKFKSGKNVSWINIDGLHDTKLIGEIAVMFGLHPLILEDIVNTDQRPKLESYDSMLFYVLKMLRLEDQTREIKAEQLSMIVGERYLLTFQERVGDVFEAVRERLRAGKGRARKSGTDYLAYILMDSVVDNYTYLIEQLGESVEDGEEELLHSPSAQTLNRLHELMREFMFLRKSIRPFKESLFLLLHEGHRGIATETLVFYRDLLDLTTHAGDAVDTYRDILTSQVNIYHSNTSTRLNEIIRVLTIFSVIFIPLSFLAGVYGTNFDYLPELHFKYSYPIFWLVIIAVAVFMLLFFKRKRWL